MSLARSVRLSVAALACAGLLSLTACSEDEEPKSATTSETESEVPAAEPSEEESESAPVEGQPEWALPAKTDGDLISTFTVGDVTIEAYQVGTSIATDDGTFVDSETKEPLLAKGDELVFVNYVVTNNGAPVDLGPNLVKITERYDDWEQLIGMEGSFDTALYEEHGLTVEAIDYTKFSEPPVFTFGTGETYSIAHNFRYQPGSPIGFEAEIVPVDAAGQPLEAKRVDGSGRGKIA
ncbi:hypothetical protein [Nocardioides pantholopis]|uniref:hypothetical protein n=1 Tax=Nocardioides pantholopis TaxID=2483798 RepID=UPI000F086690|nr:hypothetical protein [Nocardioides pantholopis]